MTDALEARLAAIRAEGWALWETFDREVREKAFHPFIAADYDLVCEALRRRFTPGARFLELGSASGTIAILADAIGYEACGIERDAQLVAMATAFAARVGSRARFAVGDFLPAGYRWTPPERAAHPVTATTESGYVRLGRPLDTFDVVFGFPWPGQAPMMLDLMRAWGDPDATLLLHSVERGVTAYRGGRALPPGA